MWPFKKKETPPKPELEKIAKVVQVTEDKYAVIVGEPAYGYVRWSGLGEDLFEWTGVHYIIKHALTSREEALARLDTYNRLRYAMRWE